MSNNFVNLWFMESGLYATLDANMMRESITYSSEYELGANQKFGISISSKNGIPISLRQPFNTRDIDVRMNFRLGSDSWLRFDNQGGHQELHMHLASGTRTFDDRIPIPEVDTVSGLISRVFTIAEKTIKWKLPEFKVVSGAGFVGFA